jgi:hypothetical protein
MVLSEPLLEAVRKMAMESTRESESPWYRAWRLELEARGEARMLLLLLKNRGFEVDPATRLRIESCDDRDRMEEWFRRALSAQSLDSIFVE